MKKFKLSNDDIANLAIELKQLIIKDIVQANKDHIEAVVERAVNEAVTAVSIEYEEKLGALREYNKDLENRLCNVEKSVAQRASASDAAEQYSRRNNVRITGIPEDSKNTDDHVIEIASDMGVSITKDQIDRSHRIGKKGDILVKFATYRFKKLFVTKKKSIRAKREGIWVCDDLKATRSHLLYKARELVRKHKIKTCYSIDGS